MNEPTAQETDRHEFPCQSCGAKLIFVPGTESLECEYCGHTQELGSEESEPIVEYSFAEARALARTTKARDLVQGGTELQCTSCGAITVVQGESARCAFCDSPVVLAQDEDEIFVPESLLPFRVTRNEGDEIFKRWLKSLWFAPNDLALRARAGGLDGVYLPYWTYDSQTTTRYTGMRGRYYYVSETYRDSEGKTRTRQVRKTRWTPAFGTVFVPFDDVLVFASRSLPRPLVDKLEPWDLAELQPYQPGFLSGFLAQRYNVDLEEGFAIAGERMQPVIRAAICRDIGGDTQRVLTTNTSHANVRFKHFLLPLWVSSFRYREKVYRFIVNARTGEPGGERPYSWIKITAAVVAAIGVIAVFAYLFRNS